MCKESIEMNKSFSRLIRYFLNKLNDFHTNLLFRSFLPYLKMLFIFYNTMCKDFKEWNHKQNKISYSFKQSLIRLVYPIREHWHVICTSVCCDGQFSETSMLQNISGERTNIQLIVKLPTLYGNQSWIPYIQEPGTGLYHKPDESNPHSYIYLF